MKLSSIDIANFRGFERFSLNLTEGVNVLIGRNGSGKTTVIDAVRRAVSFIFSNDRSLGDNFISAGATGLNITSFDSADFYYDVSSRIYATDVTVRASGRFHGEKLDWELYKRNAVNAALYQSRYKDAYRTVLNSIAGGASWPLLAYFSDSYPHRPNKLTGYPLKCIKMDRLPRNFGYYQWDDDGACTSVWELRMSNRLAMYTPYHTQAMRIGSELMELEAIDNPSEQEQKRIDALRARQVEIDKMVAPFYEETDFVESKVRDFVSLLPLCVSEGYGIDYFYAETALDGYDFKIVFKNGQSLTIKDLPAGYRRLVSIVIDIAYRSYILNGTDESSGIVIIDEIDLHLHPSLEEVVVNAFTTVFPKLQFIISTHSAAVISNLTTGNVDNRNSIMVLHNGETSPEVLHNLNGIDYNAALRDFMDTPSRNRDIKSLCDEYLMFYSLGFDNEAVTIYDKIISIVGNDSPVLKELENKRRRYDSH